MTKGQNIDQSYQSVAGIARGLYGRSYTYTESMAGLTLAVKCSIFGFSRVFNYLVERCNETLVDDTMVIMIMIMIVIIMTPW